MSAATAKRVRVGLLWHSVASQNLGVTALTVANLALARQAAARAGLTPEFVVLGPREHGPANVTGDDIETLSVDMRFLAQPNGYWALLGTLDCLLDIGAGDSFTDIYSRRRFAMMYATKRLANLRGKPLLFSPQTIGPFSGRAYKALAADVMNRASAVVARDPLSREAAAELAPSARVLESIDVAFALPYTPRTRATERIDVGLNVSGLLFNGGYAGANQYGLGFDYATLSRRLIEALLARDRVRVHLICHANAPAIPRDDDAAVADRLAAEYPALVRVPDFADASEAKSYISGLHFLIAGRMHACIAAFSSGVPVVPIAYSRKFSGLFEGVLGYRHLVPTSGLGEDAALARILADFDRRVELADDIERGSAVIAQRLSVYERELDALFAPLAG